MRNIRFSSKLAALLLLMTLLLSACAIPQIAVPVAPEAPAEAVVEAEATAEPAEEAAPTAEVDVAAAVDAYLSSIPDGFLAIGLDAFKEQMDVTDVYVIDVREVSEYEAGHIEGAVNIPIRTLAQNLDKVPSDMPVIVYCASGQRAGMATSVLRSLGYDNVRSFAAGWKGWSAAAEPVSTEAAEAGSFEIAADPALVAVADNFLSGIPEGFLAVGTVEKLETMMDATDVFLIDVREESEVAETGMIPGAVNIPIRTLGQNFDQIPTDQPVVVYCKSGFRAALALGALQLAGYQNTQSFPPSFQGWEDAEVPAAEEPAVETGAVEVDTVVATVDAYLSTMPDGFLSVSLDAFKAQMEATDVYVIDVREVSDYEAGHIEGAVNIPIRTLAQNLSAIPSDMPVIVYCASGLRAGMSVSALHALGYTNVRAYGASWKGWTANNEPVSMEPVELGSFDVPEIDPALLAAVDGFLSAIPDGYYSIGTVEKLNEMMDATEVFLLDVREDAEVAETGMIPGATHIAIRTIGQNLDQIPTDQPVIVYCKSGFRAALAAGALHVMGYNNVRAFPPSMNGWLEAGEEVAK